MIAPGRSHKSNASNIGSSGKFNRKPAEPKALPSKMPHSYLSWILSLTVRLSIWAAVLTVLFRCPPSLDSCDETSPFICKHYFQGRNAISPHVKPYYDLYAMPYINAAKPYYDAMNHHVLTPAGMYTKRYGAPWAKKSQEYISSQWNTNGQPRLVRLQEAIQISHDQVIVPHLEKAHQILNPIYVMIYTNSIQLYNHFILPSYIFFHPYISKSCSAASETTVNKAIPATYWMWRQSNLVLKNTIWPHLRLVYVENVEPQLARIGERLGRYKHKAKSKVLPQRTSSGYPSYTIPASSDPEPLTATYAPESAEKVSVSGLDDELNENYNSKHKYPVEAAPVAEDGGENVRQVREMVARDLKTWQEKVAIQAEEGTTAIEERIDEIAQRSVNEYVDTDGQRLLTQLNMTVIAELNNLKSKIISVVKVAHDDAEDEVSEVIRSAGVAVKDRAQEVRKWREEFDTQLQRAVEKSVQEHFDILDEMRSLSLQKIGMKWAWTNGITYRDWTQYHELRSTFSKWTNELQELVVSNPNLLMAQQASTNIEEEAMKIASVAAKELARLKQVAHWKVVANDSTDDFGTESMRLIAEAVQEAGIAKKPDIENQDSLTPHTKDGLDMGYSPLKVFPDGAGDGALESTFTHRADSAPFEVDYSQNHLILAKRSDAQGNDEERKASVTNGHSMNELLESFSTSTKQYKPTVLIENED